MSAEAGIIEYAASCRQVKNPYDNGDKDANAESRQVTSKLNDRAVSLNAVFDILDGIQEDIEDGEGFNYNKWKETVNELSSVTPQSCEDAISRKDAEKRIDEALSNVFVDNNGIGKSILSKVPSVTPERPKGHWIGVSSYDAFGGDYETWMAHGDPIAYHYCSECKDECYVDEDGKEILSDFCPFCGADMRGDENNSNFIGYGRCCNTDYCQSTHNT